MNSSALCQGSLGDPVVNITFGAGSSSGQPLPNIVAGAGTSYAFVSTSGNPAAPVPFDGNYTITNNVPENSAWFQGQPDHTPGDVNGYMAFFNSSEMPGEFYRQEITGLCGSTKYEFAAWVVNVLNPAVLIGVKPDITFSVTKTDGTALGSYPTGPIDQNETYKWEQFGFFFTTPGDVNTVILTMYNNNPGGNAQPGNDLAIDDITFRPCGSVVSASFSHSAAETAKTQCGLGDVSLFGSIGSQDYFNPALLWQVSINNGLTWDDLAGSNTEDFIFKPSGSGTFSFRMVTAEAANIAASSCRIVSNMIILKIMESPQGSFTGSTVCEGTVGKLFFSPSAGVPPFTIAYSDGNYQYLETNVTASGFLTASSPAQKVNYRLLSVKDASGCSRTSGFTNATATVTVSPKPALSITPPASVCAGDSIQLVVTGGDTYSWSPTSGLSSANTPNPKAAPATTTTYKITATKGGCTTSASTTITVRQRPTVTVTASVEICQGDSVQLHASGGVAYAWSPVGGLSDSSRSNPKAAPSKTTTYKVTAHDSYGCYNAANVTVTLRQKPSVSLGKDTTICNFQTLMLLAKGSHIRGYLWNNGTSDSVLNVVKSGTYSVIASNQCGDIRDEVNVKIEVCSDDVFFPSAFTPNADLLNDQFKALYAPGMGIYNYELRVYNRWGQLIYITKNPSIGWDGLLNGQIQKTDVYVWYAKYSREPNGKHILKKGTTTLIR